MTESTIDGLFEARRLQKAKKKFLKQSRSLSSQKQTVDVEEKTAKKATELGRFPGDGDSDSEPPMSIAQGRRQYSRNWIPRSTSSPVSLRRSYELIARQDVVGISPKSTLVYQPHGHHFRQYRGHTVSDCRKSSDLESLMGENMPDSDSAELVNLVSVTKGKEKVSAQAGVLSDKRQIVCQTVSERARLKEILEKNNELESQLAIQTKVNSELKKLLVASLGDDLEYRFHKLVQDKADVECRLKYHTERVLQDSEEIERLAIQSDVWRSKFVASSVMVDELAAWKAKLFIEMRDCQKALNTLMDERTEIRDQVVRCHQNLTHCVKQLEQLGLIAETDSGLHGKRQTTDTNIDSNNPQQMDHSDFLQLCKDNVSISGVIAQLISQSGTLEGAENVPTSQLSAGELLAKKALADAELSLSGISPNFQRQVQLMKREKATKRSGQLGHGDSWNTYTVSPPIFPFSEMGKKTGDTIIV